MGQMNNSWPRFLHPRSVNPTYALVGYAVAGLDIWSIVAYMVISHLLTFGRPIREPPMCLFHYRRELEAYVKTSRTPLIRNHLKLLLGYMEKTLEREIRQYGATFENRGVDASLEHQYLWMGYKPGELLYAVMDGTVCVSRLVNISKVMNV